MKKPFAVTSKIVRDIDMRFFDELKRRFDGSNQVVKVGFPEGAHEDDGTPLAMIAAVHQHGSPSQGIPERPFMTQSVRKNRMKYVQLNRTSLLNIARGTMSMPRALGLLGEMAKGDMQAEIRNGDFVPLEAQTIKRKGSSRPLIDSGQMAQSTTWELGEKDD